MVLVGLQESSSDFNEVLRVDRSCYYETFYIWFGA